ncbi:MAG: hypothetical protein E7055_18385 [Lentisphaerae bacterium]|nr:hypothetical protein [Lentisphaerota bacterium]
MPPAGFSPWIIKFAEKNDPQTAGKLEYRYSLAANTPPWSTAKAATCGVDSDFRGDDLIEMCNFHNGKYSLQSKNREEMLIVSWKMVPTIGKKRSARFYSKTAVNRFHFATLTQIVMFLYRFQNCL